MVVAADKAKKYAANLFNYKVMDILVCGSIKYCACVCACVCVFGERDQTMNQKNGLFQQHYMEDLVTNLCLYCLLKKIKRFFFIRCALM